jgi:hypothetical protein
MQGSWSGTLIVRSEDLERALRNRQPDQDLVIRESDQWTRISRPIEFDEIPFWSQRDALRVLH